MKAKFLSDHELLLNYAHAYKLSDPVVGGEAKVSLEEGDELCRITQFWEFLVLRRMSDDFWEFTRKKENKSE